MWRRRKCSDTDRPGVKPGVNRHTLAAEGPWGALHHKIKRYHNNNPRIPLLDLTRPGPLARRILNTVILTFLYAIASRIPPGLLGGGGIDGMREVRWCGLHFARQNGPGPMLSQC